MEKKSAYKTYISGLKGFACLMVMIGHYIGLYKYAEDFPVESVGLDYFGKFLDSKIGFVIDETFWVVLFFVVSGYLVANSRILNIKDAISKSFLRFLRLGLPILFAYLIIFLIYKFVGFHTAETVGIFECPFIQKPYSGTYSFLEVLKSPFDVLLLNNVSLNSPYWVLREMFITSILIYFLNWLKNKINNKNIFYGILFIALISSMAISNVIFAGLFGMALCILEYSDKKKILSNKIFVLMIIVFSAALYFIPRPRISCVFFGALILLVPKLPIINNILSSKIATFVNKISFGVYSFHWPIFCSIGMLLLVNTYKRVGLLSASLVASIVSALVTILISIIYHYCIEKHIYSLLKKLEKVWSRK